MEPNWWRRHKVATPAGSMPRPIPALAWTLTSAPRGDWSSVASSADGTRLAAGSSEGPIYVSPDSGTTWTQTGSPGKPWSSMALTADGSNLIAVAPAEQPAGDGGAIYTLNLRLPPPAAP